MGQDLPANVVVHAAAGLAEAAPGVAADRSGGDKGLAGLQAPGKVPVVEAQAEACQSVFISFGDELPVAAPGQRAEPDLAVLFVRCPAVDRKPGIGLVAGGQAPAVQDLDARRERLAADVPFVRPAPVQVTEPVLLPARQVPLRRKDTFQRDGLIAAIGDLRPALDQVILGVDPIMQHNLQRLKRIAQVDRKHIAVLHSFVKLQDRIPDAIRVQRLEARLDVFQPAFGRVFLASHLPEVVER